MAYKRIKKRVNRRLKKSGKRTTVRRLKKSGKTTTVRAKARQKNTVKARVKTVTNPNIRLKFRIKKIKCLDETKAKIISAFAKDVIIWRAVCINDKGKVTKTPSRTVPAKFKTGTSYNYHGFDLASFKLNNKYPKYFIVTIFLAEKDNKGFSKAVEKGYASIKKSVDKLVDKAAKKAGEGLDSQTGGLGSEFQAEVAAIAKKAIQGLVVGFAKLLKNKDDIFPAQTAELTLRGAKASFRGSKRSKEKKLYYTGHKGKYVVTYDWELVR